MSMYVFLGPVDCESVSGNTEVETVTVDECYVYHSVWSTLTSIDRREKCS